MIQFPSERQQANGTVRSAPRAMMPRRASAEIDGDCVMFLIGMRINRPWKVHAWPPVILAMPEMLQELQAYPALGMLDLGGSGRQSCVQYWRPCEQLNATARAHEHAQWSAWIAFNRAIKDSGGGVRIWHETSRISAGGREAVCRGVPRQGLGAAGPIVDASAVRAGACGRAVAVLGRG